MKRIIYPILILMAVALSSCREGACYYSCCVEESDCEPSCAMQTESQSECEEFAAAACEEEGLGSGEEVEWKEVNTVVCATCDSLGCAPPWWMESSYSIDTEDFLPDGGLPFDAGLGDALYQTCSIRN